MNSRQKLRWVGLLYVAEGLPFGIAKTFLPAAFTFAGLSAPEIGALSGLLQAPWSAKIFWAPLVDRLGTRRRWMQGALFTVAAALTAIALMPLTPVSTALTIALVCLAIGGATQDIAIDAYTIELLDRGEEGSANGVRVAAYRAGMLLASGGLVAIGGWIGWPVAIWLGAALAALMALTESFLPERTVIRQPVAEFLNQLRAWLAQPGSLGVLGFVLFYKLGDAAMGPMVVPFWKHSGMTPADVALVSTTFGMIMTVSGALVGGALTTRWGLFHALWILGLAQAVSNLGYAAAAHFEAGRPGIFAASLCESFTAGLGSAPFLGFMMRICDKRQAATQYALISALYNLTGTLAGTVSGVGAERWGFSAYFALTFFMALPAYVFLPWVQRRIERPMDEPTNHSPDAQT